jgi:hypothetical protein
MNKIVILTIEPELDYALIALLNMVFPDCEVSLVFSPTEALDEVTTGPSFSSLLKVF